jgi:hypothetical protein
MNGGGGAVNGNGNGATNGDGEEEKPLILDVVESGSSGDGGRGAESAKREGKGRYTRVDVVRSWEEPYFVARTGVITLENLGERNGVATD